MNGPDKRECLLTLGCGSKSGGKVNRIWMLEGVELIFIHLMLEVLEKDKLDINPGFVAWARWISTAIMEKKRTISRKMGKYINFALDLLTLKCLWNIQGLIEVDCDYLWIVEFGGLFFLFPIFTIVLFI